MEKLISIVIPAYNEGENVRTVYTNIVEVFATLPYRLQILFVNDGSADDTLEHLCALAEMDKCVDYLSFSRNFGHQAAVKAGYYYAAGDAVISMDCDMQHPPRMLPELLAKWAEGYEVVYTRRAKDEKLSWFKRKSSSAFYRFINMLSDVKFEDGTADFRLLDRKVADVIATMNETDPFLRGIVKWVGFKQYAIDYQPDQRVAGESKYTLRKMLRLAINGITSFSVRPLHLAIWVGAIISILSLLILPYVLYSIATGHAAAGWSSTILIITFLGGLQLTLIGIVGLYVGRIFVQSKQRPNYIIAQRSSNNVGEVL